MIERVTEHHMIDLDDTDVGKPRSLVVRTVATSQRPAAGMCVPSPARLGERRRHHGVRPRRCGRSVALPVLEAAVIA